MNEKTSLSQFVPEETKKEIYTDLAKPTTSELGRFVERIPRVINAAFSGVDRWILQREYSVAEVKKLMEIKLQNISAEKITTPELHIAIPAIQALSYSMDSEVLRDMYANLLSNAMLTNKKDFVHPGFVHIISQLSPQDAQLFNLLFSNENIAVPVAKLQIDQVPNIRVYGQTYESWYFSGLIYDIDENNNLLQPTLSTNNLIRLGLASLDMDVTLSPISLYDYVKHSRIYHSEEIQSKLNESMPNCEAKLHINRGNLSITDFGKTFLDICITAPA